MPVRARSRPLWYAAVFSPPPATGSSPEPLHRLALRAQRFTSFVSLEPPAALLLEIRGSLRLFGPLESLKNRIDADWEEIGVRARSAVAPSAPAALWLARAGEKALIEDPAALAASLSHLPIGCGAWNAQRLERLRAIGVVRLGDLLRLPRAGLARRFGADLIDELDALCARGPAPRRAFVAPGEFHERCEFEVEIDRTAMLSVALGPMLERCARFLRERQAGVRRLRLRLSHRAAPTTRLTLGFAGVTGDARRFDGVLAEHLSRLTLPAPVRSALLASGPLERLSAATLDAFGAAVGRDAAGAHAGALQLIERLRARLGEQAVYGVSAVAEHRPEAASRRVHALRLVAAPAADGLVVGEDVPRPVWLLQEPVLLAPRAAPAGDWRVEQGPERIESGWWDDAGIARDYYVARHVHGARLWVFQERRSGGWYLHGVFA